MRTDRGGRPGRLRERPPPWPRRDSADQPERRRWERDPEAFEDNGIAEMYPGGLVMEDLAATGDDAAALRVLVRYTVIRVLLLSASGVLTGTGLRVERRIALEHLDLLPAHDWERRALERLACACREQASPEILDAVVAAAEAAAKRSHIMGAFALYRAGYVLALGEHWWRGAARAARGVAALARLEEARYSIRLWERRAAVLEGRAARADAQAPGPRDAT